MARRRKKSSGFLTLLSRSHYSVGLFVGVIVFAAIRFGTPWGASLPQAILASSFNQPLPTAPSFSDQTLSVLSWLGLGGLLACWLCAAVSWHRSRAGYRLLDQQTSLASLRDLSWQDFERLVAAAYRREGFQVKENGGGGADGGIDLLLKKNGKTTLVQCKQWKSKSVSVMVVREMWGLAAHHGFHAVKIVSVGEFTSDALAFAAGKPIELVNGQKLLDLVRSVHSSPEKIGPPGPIASRPASQKQPSLRLVSSACPRCGASMVERQSRQGGDSFLGCSKFPACRGTLPIIKRR